MGIDAPSTDLTNRIRALRKAGVANGDIEPALPGEHTLHGRGGVDIERLSVAHAAQDRRAARTALPEVTDYSALEEEGPMLSPEDGGEDLGTPEASADDTIEPAPVLPDEVDEPFDLGPEEPAEPEYVAVIDTAQSDAVQAEILARVEEVHTRLDGQDTAFLLLAKALTDAANDHEAIGEMLVVLASRLSPRPSRWQRFVAWLRS